MKNPSDTLVLENYIPKELSDIEKKYYELIYAVGSHYEGESRHETALRYIREAENSKGSDVACENIVV